MTEVDINKIFTYHAPSLDQTKRHDEIRGFARSLAHIILTDTPASAEQTLAIRHLQQAVMFANAAIAINE